MHYKRRSRGAPMWRTGGIKPVTYSAAHYRVRSARGEVTGFSCKVCGNGAVNWAYNHNSTQEVVEVVRGCVVPYSENPEDYDPMCRSCHNDFDSGRVKVDTTTPSMIG
jgi:hypothetical protein